MLGQRGAVFAVAMPALAEEMDELKLVTADLSLLSGMDRYIKAYPDKFLNVGIAEQNMIGIASGLASEGYNVFASSFAAFVASRCYEQVRLHAGYMHHNIKIAGLASGIGVDYQGNTHYGLDDICTMRNIPGLTIVAPADCYEVANAVEALMDFEGPVYLRLCGESNNPMVYKAPYDFKIGKAVPLVEGNDVAIFATGTMVNYSLKAAKTLAEEGINCSVVNIHTIKPIDDEAVKHYAENAKKAGLQGVVCSALEAPIIKEMGLISVTPGIRFKEDSVNDQKRVATPLDAKELGSTYIVVGRSITAASNPLEAYLRCVKEFC
jgi:transketolase